MCAKYIVPSENFKPSEQIIYTEPKINKNNGINIGILNKEHNKSLYISTPLMFCWGVNKYTDDKSGRVSYTLSLQFPGNDYIDEKTKNFLNSLKEMEDMILNDAIKNCKTWLNRAKLSHEVAKENMTPIVRYPKDKDTKEIDYTKNPTLTVKVPYYENNFMNVEIYDLNSNQLFPSENTEYTPETLIQKATNVALIIQCGGIYNVGGRFGVTWKLVQAVVKPKESLQGKCHITLDSNDKDKLASQVDDSEINETEEKLNNCRVDSSDSESNNDSESESSENEEPQQPVKQVAAKVVRKRVVKKT